MRKQSKNKYFILRVSPDEDIDLLSQAAKRGLNKSDFVRLAVKEFISDEKAA